jgi:hypothetical protein
MKRVFISLVILTSLSLQAKISSSDWKTGTLKRVTKDHLTGESGQLGKKPPKHGVYVNYYFVESENYLYEGDDVKLKQSEKGFPVSVNSQVKFFLDGNDMYLQDDRGRKHKLRLVNVLPTNSNMKKQVPTEAPK